MLISPNLGTVLTLSFALVTAAAGCMSKVPTDSTAFVGRLIANTPGDPQAPLEYCLPDGVRYQGPGFRLGRKQLVLERPPSPSTLNGPALVVGTPQRGLDQWITKLGRCEATTPGPLQMRSDWVADEADARGRTTRKRLAATTYIKATQARPLRFIETTPLEDPQSLRLTLTNIFDRAFDDDLEFSLYYEGGPGKPMPKFVPKPLGNLAPGASISFTVPRPDRALKRRRKKAWNFRGYRLSGQIGAIRVDLLVNM